MQDVSPGRQSAARKLAGTNRLVLIAMAALGAGSLLAAWHAGNATAELTDRYRSQLRRGDLPAAIDSAQRLLAAADSDLDRALAQAALGQSLLLARRIQPAIEVLPTAIVQLKEANAAPASTLSGVVADYGAALIWAGRMEAGERILRNHAATLRETRGVELARVWNAMGLAQALRGNATLSERWYRQALELTDSIDPPPQERAASLAGLGLAQLESGHAGQAEETLRAANDVYRIMFEKITPQRADVLTGLGRALLAQNKIAQSLPLLAAAHSFWIELDRGNRGNRGAGIAAHWYGRGLLAAGEAEQAQEILQRAAAILKVSPIPADTALIAEVH